jgi:threonine dehydratase
MQHIGMEPPNLTDVLLAQKRIRPYLLKTPLHTYPTLNEVLGMTVYVKHENYQPTNAFKIRGGINLISQLNPEEKAAGVITASTGNHGQSIALASKIFGVKAIVCVQEGANPTKVAGIKSYGANRIEKGKDVYEARENAESLANKHGYRYIHSGNEPLLIAGVGTMALEMIEDQPDLNAIITPVGAGTNCAGVATVIKSLNPQTQVIAVQAENAPSVYMSWKSGKLESTETAKTMADGLATRQAFELPTKMLRALIDDFVLVSENELRQAIKMYIMHARTIAEGAGAASLAAAIKLKSKYQGKKVGLVLSGGNLTYENLLKCID